jgi:GT2 family glycosyltransferase
MAKFGIGIPTFNRWDLLESSLEKYILDFPNIDIHILDNGQQNIPDYHYNNANIIYIIL